LCLDAGADIDIDYKGITMLQLAGLVDSTELLIERGANIHSKKENLNGMSLLHFAAGLNHFNSAGLLIKLGFKVNINDDSGMTPLHWACKYTGKVKTLEFLLTNGADVNAKDIKGNTPLHYAVQKTEDGSVRFSIDNGADVYIKSNYGKMPKFWK